MAYSFRYYGKNWLDHDDFDVPHLEYCLQFKGPLTPAQRERLAELVETSFTDGAADPDSTWLWSQRFLLAGFGARYRFANGAVCARVTDFLMEARRVCPLVDVVCRTATVPGTSKWDLWTIATQPTPDPGPDWGTHARYRGPYPRPLDPSLPAPAPDPVFDDARVRTRGERRRQRILSSLGHGSGLALTAIAPADLPPPAAPPPARPDTVPAHLRFAPHPDGTRAIAVDPGARTGEILEIALPDGALRRQWTCDLPVSDLTWLDDLWALRTPDTVLLVDPDTEPPALAAEPFGVKGRRLDCVLGSALLNTHRTAPGKASLTLLARTRHGKLGRVTDLTLSDPLFLDCERQGRIFLRDDSGHELRFELHGVPALLAALTKPPEPAKRTTASAADKKTVALVPVEALPDDDAPWPEVGSRTDPRSYLAQQHPDGASAAFVLTRRKQGHPYFSPVSLRIAAPGEPRRELERSAVLPDGYGFKDLALSPDGRHVLVAAIAERFGEAGLCECSSGFLPERSGIPNRWCFVELRLADALVRTVDEVELAPSPREDGQRTGYKCIRRVARPGGHVIHLWNKQPYHTMRWLDPDHLLVAFDKGALCFRRDGDAAWSKLGHAKASGVLDAVGLPGARAIAVLGTGKTRLTVFAERGGKLRKLAAFTDNLTAVERRGERLFARRADTTWCELGGL